jgi:hypothetical protein
MKATYTMHGVTIEIGVTTFSRHTWSWNGMIMMTLHNTCKNTK